MFGSSHAYRRRARRLVLSAPVAALFLFSLTGFSQIPAGYYDSAAGQSGQALADALHEIIDDHVRYPYTATETDTWDIISVADEDPANSANILTIYSNESKPKDDHSAGTGWNREHTWPKSYGFPDDGGCNYPYTDIHHLTASDWNYNSARSNKPYDNCDVGCDEWPAFNASSSNWTAGSFDAGSWEPWDDVKGDLARGLFYMAVRYNGGTHGATGCDEPDLRLTNDRNLIQTTNGGVAYMGILDTLLAWHLADPVDGFEQARNEVVFSFQGNRNPFVDHPEWVTDIFGAGNGDGGSNGGGGTGSEPEVWINEVHYDNDGTDVDEGVEIAGAAGSSLIGWELVAYNGSGGTAYQTLALTGSLPNQQNGYGTLWFPFAGLQNGAPDGLALVSPSGNVVQLLSYEGVFTALDGPAAGISSTDIVVSEPGTDPVGNSLQLGGTGTHAADFTWEVAAAHTNGLVNGNQHFGTGGGGGGTGDGVLWINEIHYDNASTDAGEGVEIAGPTGTVMDGWSLVGYNGNGGTVYNTTDLSGTLGGDGYGFAWFAIAGLQNGAPDGIALVDPTGTVVEFLSYEGAFTAVDGPAAGIDSTDILVAETSSTPLGFSLQLGGTGTKGSDFSWQAESAATEGAINTNQSFPTGGAIWINELHYDNAGTDTGEGIEIAGPAGSNTDGWQLVAYNGNGGAAYGTTDLSGTLGDDFQGHGFAWYAVPGLQNGSPDGVALVDPTGTVVQFLSYEGSFAAVDGPAAGLTSDDIGIAEDGATPAGYSLQLTGTGTAPADFSWIAAPATEAAVNDGQSFDTGGGGGGGGGGTVDGPLWINELHYDNASTDSDEGVEIAGPAGTVLDGWQLVAYNGNGGASYATIDLSGTLADDHRGFGFLWVDILGLQNGAPDGIALVDPTGGVVHFLSYEGALTAVDGPAMGLTSDDIGVFEPSDTPVGSSLQLTGTGSAYADFTWQAAAPNTYGAVNSGQVFPVMVADPWINELHYDNASTDGDEGVEIAGEAGLNLDGWQLVAYNGNGGASYGTVALTGVIDDEGAGYGALWFPIAGLQNGSPDGVALVDPAGTVVQFLSYEGSFAAVDGAAAGATSDDIGVSEPSDSPVGYSLQLVGTGTAYAAFSWQAPAPHSRGDLNVGQSLGTAPPDFDNDGVADADDLCGMSDVRPRVVINGCDTGVTNWVSVDGCTLADLIAECAAGNPPRWVFSGCVNTLLSDLVAAGDITSAEKTAVMGCVSAYGLPTANDDAYTTDWSTTLVVDAPGVLANDTDPTGDTLEAHLYSGPATGTLSLFRDGGFRYVPVPGIAGPVTFVYKAWDGSGYRTGTVTIEVTAGNQAPVTGNDLYTMSANSRLTVGAPGVLANDHDPEGAALTSYLYSGPAVGQLGFHQDGSFWYEPPLNYTGSVSFVYRAGDGDLKTAATVTIQVN